MKKAYANHFSNSKNNCKSDILNIKGNGDQKSLMFSSYSKDNIIGKSTIQFETYNLKNFLQKQNFNFNLIDSPGYNSNTNTKEWFENILGYIHNKVILINLV